MIGFLQIPALLPGSSRSGSTVAAGLLGGLAPAAAVSMSFLAGVPLIAAAAAKDAVSGGWGALYQEVDLYLWRLGLSRALLSGYAALGALRWLVRYRRLKWFASYCVVIAVVCFTLYFSGN